MLDKFNGNKSKAARVLNISRSTLREKLKQYGIS
jgi:DNA-binding protein Fis